MSTYLLDDNDRITAEMLGDKIRQARKLKEMSQIELASEIGVSDKAVSSYEVGRAIPPVDILQKISITLNKPIAYFFNESEDKQSTLADKVDQMIKELNEIKQLVS